MMHAKGSSEGNVSVPATEHDYYSTSCYHNEHEYCKSHTGLSGAKKPGHCKFCDAPCGCWCHTSNVIFERDLMAMDYKPIGWLDWDGNFHPMESDRADS